MGSEGIFSGTISILEKNLDLRSVRHNLIISNIANKDTPNYKAFDLAVEEELQKLTGSQEDVGLMKTHAAHLPVGKAGENYSGVTITSSSHGSAQNGDGNTVIVEEEMTNLAENNLLYGTMAQLIRKKFQGLKFVIQGGK